MIYDNLIKSFKRLHGLTENDGHENGGQKYIV